MTLTLRAVSLNDHPLTQPITAQFSAAGGSVGRGDHNTLALPDPERHISRQQAEISANQSGYQIRNVGSANPITVRGQALARGESMPIEHSDQIRIGGYLLEVVQVPVSATLADATLVRGRDALSDFMAGPAPAPRSVDARAAAAIAAPAALAPAGPWHGESHELWAALCDGAAVPLPALRGIDPEVMRAVGGVLRAAVAGTLQLMAVRAGAKHELRAPVTVIQARQNNPLKLSPDARAAIEQLLQAPQRGFLDAPAAMTDAMHDLVGHTLATMAGTRAALDGVLDQFAPPRLQAQLRPPSVLDSVLPMQRKARLWALYVQQFEALHDTAQDDFEALFGRAFRVAYKAQIERLRLGSEAAEAAEAAGSVAPVDNVRSAA